MSDGPGLPNIDYAAVLNRRKWIVVATTVLMTAISFGNALVQSPTYEASVDLVVERQGSLSQIQELNDLLVGQQDLATQLQIITSMAVANRAAETLGVGLNANQLLNRVTAQLIPETRVVRIITRDQDAGRAQEIAQTMAESYLDYRRETALEVALGASNDLVERTRLIRDRIAQLEDVLAESPDDAAAQQERRILLEQIGQLSAQLTTLESSEAFARGGGQILRPARLPAAPVEPQPTRSLALGLAFGLALGVALALLVERLDDRPSSMDEVSRLAGGLPVLVALPRVVTDPATQFRTDPHGQYAEGIRTLLANIRLSGPPGSLDILLVTSPKPGDGKSSVAVNMATASALGGTRTILLDADLRKPRIRELMGLPRGEGLAEVLLGTRQLSEVAADPGIPNLRVIGAGMEADAPVELLSGKVLRDTLAECARECDLLIVDAPPAVGLADVLPLAVHADATLLVVDIGDGSRRVITEAITRLRRVGGILIGIAGNRVPTGEAGDPYYYDYSPAFVSPPND